VVEKLNNSDSWKNEYDWFKNTLKKHGIEL